MSVEGLWHEAWCVFCSAACTIWYFSTLEKYNYKLATRVTAVHLHVVAVVGDPAAATVGGRSRSMRQRSTWTVYSTRSRKAAGLEKEWQELEPSRREVSYGHRFMLGTVLLVR